MSRKSRSDSDGPSSHSHEAHFANQAVQFVRYCSRWVKSVGAENHIRSIALYPPSVSRNGQWLVVGKSWAGGYRMVAFHRSSDPLTALVGFFQRAAEEKLIWKRDEYAEGNLPQ